MFQSITDHNINQPSCLLLECSHCLSGYIGHNIWPLFLQNDVAHVHGRIRLIQPLRFCIVDHFNESINGKTNKLCVNLHCWWFQMYSLVNLLLIFGIHEGEPISYVQFAIVWTDDGCFRWIIIAEEMEEIEQIKADIVIHWLQNPRGLIEIDLVTYEW